MHSKNKSARPSSSMSVARRLSASDMMSAPSSIGWFRASTSASAKTSRTTQPLRSQAIAPGENIKREDESGCRGTCHDDSVQPRVWRVHATSSCNINITSQDSHHPHVSLAQTRPKHEPMEFLPASVATSCLLCPVLDSTSSFASVGVSVALISMSASTRGFFEPLSRISESSTPPGETCNFGAISWLEGLDDDGMSHNCVIGQFQICTFVSCL